MAKKVLTNKDFELAEPNYLVDGLFDRKGLIMFVGASQAGKSIFLLNLAACVSGKGYFLGRETLHGSVIFLNNDNPNSEFPTLWVDKYTKGHNLSGSPFSFTPLTDIYKDLTNQHEMTKLLDLCIGAEVKLLCIDCLGASLGGKPEHNDNIQKAFDQLHQFIEKGIVVIVIHHFIKDRDIYRGAGSIEQRMSQEYSFFRGLNNEGSIITEGGTIAPVTKLESIIIRNPKNRNGGELHPFLVKLKDTNERAVLTEGGQYEDLNLQKRVECDIDSYFSENPTKALDLKQLADELGHLYSITLLQETVQSMISTKTLEFGTHGGTRRLISKAGAVGVEAVGPKSLGEELEIELSNLLTKYREEGKTDLSLLEDLTKPLLEVVKVLSSLTSTNDDGTVNYNGIAQRISATVKKLGISFTRVHKTDGVHFFLN